LVDLPVALEAVDVLQLVLFEERQEQRGIVTLTRCAQRWPHAAQAQPREAVGRVEQVIRAAGEIGVVNLAETRIRADRVEQAALGLRERFHREWETAPLQ